MMHMFCSNCGKQVSDTAKFCAHCGAPQSAPVEAAPTFVPPVQEFTPPAQEFTPPVQQFTPPVQEFTPPAQQFTPPVQNYAPQYYPQQPAYEPPAAPKKKKGWIAIVAAVVVVAIIAGILVLTLPSAEEKRYEQAVTLYEAGKVNLTGRMAFQQCRQEVRIARNSERLMSDIQFPAQRFRQELIIPHRFGNTAVMHGTYNHPLAPGICKFSPAYHVTDK